ncbi:hypothetical protein S7711_02927 [Stachybotrys chartarum IBT 7711]|uniref:FAD-binding PCMH-type domain-containing protein n=1 Tax=Stachybotrys chartarum (strain CBS 109288 / IBT 7711) TaxID=1280523 RepID=A0A084B2B7_STACB|nr:hypothetical protein S7711_02927 [Stachybotrys chartarum IBT 7711]KFA55967.1 hypothetical protein S40293_03993 [Stachybotrys chartarum IBT 40293]KFA80845.1 hypothetical protein S40288_08522 [Stachybotrys chartarum IBT 40288]
MVRSLQAVASAAAVLCAGLSNAQSTGYTSCDAIVDAGLAERLFLGTGATAANYSESILSYYSGTQREITPFCVFQPHSTEEVSLAVKALAPLSAAGKWNIAVRSAGHSVWNNNNIAQGITIDLRRINQTTVHNTTCKGTAVASIGAGAQWGPALLEIEKYGLTMTAGRVGNVGVAGLTLGGGLSFHSGRRGLACDDVVNYEVVLADGSIVNANKTSNARLFKALKGGGSNFGIVTRFDFAAFPGGDIYGGTVFSTWDQKDAIVDSFQQVITDVAVRPSDSEILLFRWDPAAGGTMVGAMPVSTANNASSPMFKVFDDIPVIYSGIAHQTYGELAMATWDSGGQRNVWFSLCFHNDRRVIDKAEELMHGLISDTEAFIPDNSANLIWVFQPLAKAYGRNSANNVVGLDTTLTHDSIVWLGEAFCDTAMQEAFFQARLGAISAELEAYAISIGANTQWRYMNYVNPAQDPISSYGAENVAFIRDVANEYDPTGFFQTRVSGGFKISAL